MLEAARRLAGHKQIFPVVVCRPVRRENRRNQSVGCHRWKTGSVFSRLEDSNVSLLRADNDRRRGIQLVDNAKRFPSPRHSLHLSWIQRNSVVLNSFDIHAGGSATRGRKKEKVGRRRVSNRRARENHKGEERIYYYYEEGYRLMIAWITRVFPITIVGRVLHALFICFLQSVCEKVFCFLKKSFL